MSRSMRPIAITCLTASALIATFNAGCSGTEPSGAPGTGGATSASMGGTQSPGGASATTGGEQGQGGMGSTGGAKAQTGGASNSGGSPSTGGKPAATGGNIQTGGASDSGGSPSTGGKPAATGGNVQTGGNLSTGGKSASGGAATGGAAPTGGSKATGGNPATGGKSATGGVSNTGGMPGTGGGTSSSSTHMYTSGSDLYTYCGEKVLLRGINQMSVWTDPSGNSYPAIASFGTNAIRIVYNEAGSAGGLDTLLSKAEANKMISIPEIHDATGTFSGVAAAVNWWTQSAVVAVIKKHEKWTLLNIANEAGDGSVTNATFQSTYTSAITSIRNAGIVVPIVTDGSGWGQNVEQLLAVGPALLAADPQKNVVFSWHEYTGGSQENARITTSLEKSKSLGIVLINGEFASGGAGTCTANIPYKFLLSEAQRLGTGWLAWSWDTSNSDCMTNGSSIFNMTTNLTSASGLVAGWPSDVVRDDPNSIKNTSVRHCEWK